MVYVRGSRHDYDTWSEEGCEGWSYRDVLPYFMKSEDIQIPELKNSGLHWVFTVQTTILFWYYGFTLVWMSVNVEGRCGSSWHMLSIQKCKSNSTITLFTAAYHGSGGPLQVKDGRVTPLAEVYRKALEEVGYSITDCNGQTQTGTRKPKVSLLIWRRNVISWIN